MRRPWLVQSVLQAEADQQVGIDQIVGAGMDDGKASLAAAGAVTCIGALGPHIEAPRHRIGGGIGIGNTGVGNVTACRTQRQQAA